MSLMQRHSIIISASTVILAVVCIAIPLSARFLADDVPPPETQALTQQPQTAQKQSTGSVIPSDTARNITAIIPSGEKNSVQITWDAAAPVQDAFIVLRSSSPLSTPDMIQSALQIKVIPLDNLRIVIDRNLQPGRYYYAVLPKTKYDQKSFQLYASENYTTNPVIVASDVSLVDSRTVGSLKAVTVDDRTVLLSWEPVGNFNGDYVIFRSRTPIDTQEKLSQAEPVARVPGAKSRYLDNDAGPGRHFYAVECKTVDGVLYADLKKDFNITLDPVFVGGVIAVKNIRAQREGANVLITWKSAADTLSRNYYLIRTEIQPAGKESLAGSYIVDTVQSFAEKYADRNVPAGKYFYVLAPANYRDDEDFTLTRGINVTDPAVVIADTKKKEAEREPVQKEPAKKEPVRQESSVKAAPVPEKIVPDTKIEIPVKQETSQPATSDDSDLIKLVEIPVYDAQPSAVIAKIAEPFPFAVIPQKSLPEIPAVKIAEPETAPVKKEPAVSLPENTTSAEAPRSADIKQPEQDKVKLADTARTERKKPVRNEARKQSGDVNEIVDRLFKRGNFKQTVKELAQILPGIEGKDAATARYYIGRSYVELKKYSQAVGYLSDAGVQRYYQQEADFWRDYSIEHMR